MKENYGIDLEAIAKGPNDWDIQPHPEIPGNNDEDGGDDDDPGQDLTGNYSPVTIII